MQSGIVQDIGDWVPSGQQYFYQALLNGLLTYVIPNAILRHGRGTAQVEFNLVWPLALLNEHTAQKLNRRARHERTAASPPSVRIASGMGV